MTYREKSEAAEGGSVEAPRKGSQRPDPRSGDGLAFEDRHELPYADELKRKAIHLVALIIPLAIWFMGNTLALVLLGIFSVLALAADFLRVRSSAFARHLYRYFGFMMRPEECPAVGEPIVLNGATWVLLSATLLLLLFPVDITILAFTAFMVGDAAAAVVGRRWGRRRWKDTTRTMEGSAAFLAVTVLVMLPFGWIPVFVTLLSSVAGAAAEIPSRPLNDNIRVPLVMGAVMYGVRLLTG